MDFESLKNFITNTANQNCFNKYTKKEEYSNIEKNYSLIEKELFRIGYKFKDKTEIITFIRFVDLLSAWGKSSIDISRYTDFFFLDILYLK